MRYSIPLAALLLLAGVSAHAARGTDHERLVEELSRKLNGLIGAEVGKFDDGRYLPDVPGMTWAVTEFKNL